MSAAESALTRPDTLPNESNPRRTLPISRRELVTFGAVLASLVLLELVALRATSAITRPLWLDEIHTYLLAGTQSVGESMRSLAAGADYNPPTLYLLYRVVGRAVGGLDRKSTRLNSSH